MRFAQVHKFSVYVLAVLSLVVLGAGGELPPLSVLLVAVGVVLSWFAEGELIHAERYVRGWNVALLLVFGLQLARATLFGTDWLIATVELASFLQVLLLANRRSARNYQQITSLALLQLIAATVLGGGLSYAFCFMGFVIATPWAMTLGHLRREIEGNYLADARAGRAGVPIDVARILRSRRVVGVGLLAGSSLLAVPIFLLTAVVFVLFPRIGLGVLSIRPRAETTVAGFGNQVDLSGHGVIRNDPTVVLRLEPANLPENPPLIRPFRLRGTTFDTYNGRGWTRRSSGAMHETVRLERDGTRYALSRMPDTEHDVAMRVVLDPLDPPVVFIPEGAVGLRVDARFENGYPRYADLTVDRDDGVRYTGAEEVGLVYTVYAAPTAPHALPRRAEIERARSFRARYLQLPRTLSPRVHELAARITQGASGSLDKARLVERYLSNYRYTLRLESGQAAQPLEDFLFRSRAGHCEYFSTAMAVLLRAADVPTRNVTGFLGGTFNRYGRFYAVHQGDAHSWVEVWDAQQGWVTFDPTPPAGEVPVLRSGVLAEVDAVVEAMRMRWRHYIVGFDLSTQAQIAQRLWRYVEARRARRGIRTQNWNRAAAERSAHGPGLSLRGVRPVIAVAVGGALLLLLATQIRAWRRAPRAALARARTHAQRAAQDLARALDDALAARGTARPPNRSPLAFASELSARGDPMGAAALRVARRYTAARFGDEPLGEGELDALRAELRAAREAAQRAAHTT